MQKWLLSSVAVSTCLFNTVSAYAATPINLAKQPAVMLKSLVPAPQNGVTLAATSTTGLIETSRNVDQQQNTHIRVQQYYQGVPVFGADAVVHVPAKSGVNRSLASVAANPGAATSMNGMIYRDINLDLQNKPKNLLDAASAESANSKAATLAKQNFKTSAIETISNKLIVMLDKNNKARWAYLVQLRVKANADNQVSALPVYIVDAETLQVAPENSWNNLRTAALEETSGGGFGGNLKTGELTFDGLPSDMSELAISRDSTKHTCYLQNHDMEVYSHSSLSGVMKFNCNEVDAKHNQLYFDTTLDQVNGGYAPGHDTLYAGMLIKRLYSEWLNIPMLTTKDGKPMKLKMTVHFRNKYENAAWDPDTEQMYIGDGEDMFYPLTSYDVIAHEVSHGYTAQHSKLVYRLQSGSMDESFSDMASQAAKVMVTGKTDWTLGGDIMKEKNAFLRYIDRPTKDCEKGSKPGYNCSIDDASQYDELVAVATKYIDDEDERQSYIVHLASGVYNHAFYFLSTTPGWDVKKAFILMAHANANNWTSNSTFEEGACGVLRSAKDLGYETQAVINAFGKVAVETKQC